MFSGLVPISDLVFSWNQWHPLAEFLFTGYDVMATFVTRYIEGALDDICAYMELFAVNGMGMKVCLCART